MIDHTHDPAASSWVPGADDHMDFPVQNLPLGVFDLGDGTARIGTAIGDWIADLGALSHALPEDLHAALAAPSLNALFALPGSARLLLRHAMFALLTDSAHQPTVEPHLHPQAKARMQLPMRIGDYTDFYVGIHHAQNIGKQFRPDNPLLPNYKFVPIGYHGRASSIRVSGEPVIRPRGQRMAPDETVPSYGPSRRLDYELEMGVWIARENALGSSVPIADAAERFGGLCLLNDWSARDIQAWEYQPLGPFLAKSFHTTISPWIVTAEALEPFRIAQPARPAGDPEPLPYLWHGADQKSGALSIRLEVAIRTAQMRQAGLSQHRLSAGPAANMYWTVAQMIAHHGSNGCNLRPGDLLGTGTISGPERDAFGSLAEISRGGTQPVALPNGEIRPFLEDGDELVLRAKAHRDGFKSIGFGLCVGTIAESHRAQSSMD